MSSNLEILDISTLTKTAWELYNECCPLAQEAPDGFRNLVTELGSLQGTLRALSDDLNSNTSFFERMGKDRKQTFERWVTSSFQTLQRLKNLIDRYRELGIGVDRQFWQKIKWVTQRTQVANLRSRIMVHTCNLSLCMSPIGKYVPHSVESMIYTDYLQ